MRKARSAPFSAGSRRLVLLLRGETEEAVRETAYEFCQNLRHELCQVLGWNALCAIGAPVSRVSALPESYRTAKDTLLQASACAEDGVFGSTDFAGVQHEFDFSAGGSLADKLRHAAPEDVPRIVDGYFGDSAAQDVQSVLYRYYLLMNLGSSRPLSWLMRCRQAAFRLRRIRRRCLVRRRRSRAQRPVPPRCSAA